jgi:hypothetical protein
MTIFVAKKIYTLDEEDQVFNNLMVEGDKISELTNELPSGSDELKVL